jgi:MFS family permease
MTESKSAPASARWVSLPRNVWIVTLTSLFTDISSEMLASLIPLFLADVLGATTAAIGVIEGVAETTASLLKVASGWLSDRLGQRKWLAVAGYAISTVSKPFLYFARSWGWVLAVRFGDRVGKGIRTSPRDALLADSVPASQRGLAFGVHRAGDSAGAVIGLLVALIVVAAAQSGSLSLDRSVFQTLVLLSIVPAILAVLGLAFGAKEIPVHKADKEPAKRTSDRMDRRFRIFLIIMAIFTLGNSSDAFLILRAKAAGLSVLGILGMMVTFNVIYSLVSGPAGALSDRIGRRRLLIAGWFIYALIYLGFSQVTAGWQAWVLMSAYGLYYGATEGVAKALVADLVPREKRGTAYGVFNATIGILALPASVIAGVLWQGAFGWSGLGRSAPFIFGSAMAALASALLVFALPSDHPSN